jgi:prepilin-type N-terminal cleavage/methylation domain-containing protein
MARKTIRHKGLSLIEVVISTMLVGIVLVGAINGLGAVFKTQLMAVEYQIGPSIAKDLLAEIMSTPYTDQDEPNGPIGLEAGELGSDRSTFDDVDDYHNWSSESPTRRDGTALTYGSGWHCGVTVAFVIPNNLAYSASDTGLKLITVTVTSPSGALTALQALCSRRGLTDYLPSIETTYVTACRLELQLSSTTVDVVTGKELKNHAIGP